MPIEVAWGNDQKNLILIAFPAKWDLNDMHSMIDDVKQLLTTVQQRVNIIADFRQSPEVPASIVTALGRIERFMPLNLGIVVAVSAPPYLQVMLSALRNNAPGLLARTACVKHMERALEMMSRR